MNTEETPPLGEPIFASRAHAHAPARFTTITYTDAEMGKTYSLQGDRIAATTGGNGSLGRFKIESVSSLTELYSVLEDYNRYQIMVHGVPCVKRGDTGYVHSGRIPNWMALEQVHDICRTKEDLPDPRGVGIVTFDSDYDTGPKAWTHALTSPSVQYSFLTHVFPELRGVGLLVRPSGSNGVCYPDGTPRRQTSNYHTHAFCDASERSAIIERLHNLAAVRGYGWIMLSTSGGMLTRSPFDMALRNGNQPVFASRPAVQAPLLDKRPEAVLREGRMLRLADLPEVSERDAADAWRSLSEDPDLLSRQRSVKALYRKTKAREALRLVPKEKRTASTLRKALQHQRTQERMRDAAVEGQPLPADFELYFADGRMITVGEILANFDKYNGAKMRDPMEPDYNGGAQNAMIVSKQGRPCCVSLAHGRKATYWLDPAPLVAPTNFTVGGKQVEAGVPPAPQAVPTAPAQTPITGEVLDPETSEYGWEAALPYSLEYGERTIRDEVERFVAHGGKAGLRGEAGVGKSRAVARAMAASTSEYFLLLSPNTDKSREAMRDYEACGGVGGYVYLGRGQRDPQSESGAFMCTEPQHVADKLAMRDTEKGLCYGCPLAGKGECGYDRQKKRIKDIQPRVIFASHQMAYYPIHGWEPTKVIVDESLTYGGVDLSIRWNRFEYFVGVNDDDVDGMRRAALAGLERLRTAPIDLSPDGRAGRAMKELLLTLIAAGERVVTVGSDVCVPIRQEYLYKDRDTLVIDASMSKLLTQMYLGKFDRFVDVPVLANHHVTQVLGNKFGRHAVSNDAALMAQLKKLSDGYGARVFDKRVYDGMELQECPNSLYFGKVRGTNVFETRDSIFVCGYCQPDEKQLRVIAEVLTGQRITQTSYEATEYIVTREPCARSHETKYRRHKNAVMQALIESAREEEIYQAAHRTRPVRHKGTERKRLVLLTPVVTRLAVDVVVQWADFKEGRTQDRLSEAIDREGGVLELGAKKLSDKYPDLYPSVDTAKRDLRKVRDRERSDVKSVGQCQNGALRITKA